MSDYKHIKALRYKPTEEDIDKIYQEIQDWRKANPTKYPWIEDKIDWCEYLEYIKCPELFKHDFGDSCGYFAEGYGDDCRYLDFILCSDYGEESGDWYRARYTTSKEQAKHKAEFEKVFPGLDMNRVHVVDFCYYNGCEPNDCWDPDEDEFYKEV